MNEFQIYLIKCKFQEIPNMPNHYDTLDVPKDADSSAIKKAYRKLSMTFHPDKHGGDGEEFKKISEAYQVLSDPEKKNKYDNPMQNVFPTFTSSYSSPLDPTGFASMDTNFFASLFAGVPGGFTPGQTQHVTPKSQNINHKVLLTLEDFYVGKTCKFAVSRKVQCTDCDGEGGWGKKQINCIGCNGEGFRVSQRGYNSVSRSACIQCRGHKKKQRSKKSASPAKP